MIFFSYLTSLAAFFPFESKDCSLLIQHTNWLLLYVFAASVSTFADSRINRDNVFSSSK